MVFVFAEAASPSALIDSTWSSVDLTDGVYWSAADACWDLIVVRPPDREVAVLLSGPSTRPQRFDYLAGSRNLGLRFRVGVRVVHSEDAMVDRTITLPVRGERFRLCRRWRVIPAGVEDLASLADDLARDGALSAVTWEHEGETPSAMRARQRRVRSAIGMSARTVAPIERARAAANRLTEGIPILAVVEEFGFADQAHLTRDLRRFTGFTPRSVVARRERV